MKLRPILLVSIVLVAAVLVSGCVGQQQVSTSSTDGVVITSFSASPSSLLSKEDVTTLELDIENQGAVDAKNLTVLFEGIQDQWRNATSPYNKITTQLPKYYVTLKAPQSQLGIPGDAKIITVNIKPPVEIPPGQPPTRYPISAKVFYDYKTTGVISVQTYDLSYWRNVLKGTAPSGKQMTVITNPDAPVKLELDSAYLSKPVIVSFDENSDVYEYNYKFVLKNVGSGYPVQEYGKITGKMTTTGAFKFRECAGKAIDSNTFTITPDVEDLTRLKENSQTSIPCTIYVDKNAWGQRFEDTFTINFNFDYRYFVGDSVDIYVSTLPR